jgi:starvation-inducible outer membrane lipoprotein
MAQRRPALLIAALATVLAACTTAPAPVQMAEGGPKLTAAMEGQLAQDGTPIQCRSIDRTGTRFAIKECKSEAAWEELDAILAASAKEQTDKFQRLNTGCSTQGNCP